MSRFPSVEPASSNRTAKEWRNSSAFAGLTAKGQIQSWGDPSAGGIVPEEATKLQGVKQIYSTQRAFAALTDKGKVFTWGDSSYGGDSSKVQSQLQNIRKISSTAEAFAAITHDGKVITWGSGKQGGNSSGASKFLQEGVVDVYSTDGAFAARKLDGSVVVWGDEFSGGVRGTGTAEVAFENATQIRSTTGAFAAILKNKTVETRGYWNNGGVPEGAAVAALKSGRVKDVFSNDFTFAALMSDGSVVPWGSPSSGGNTSDVESELKNVVDIVGNRNAYAARTKKGSIVSWGISGKNYSDVSDKLSSKVKSVTASDQAFAALKTNGAVVTWGSPAYGADSSAVASQLYRNVVEVVSTDAAFAARKIDGSVVTWGSNKHGGDSRTVAEKLKSGVTKLYTTDSAITALKKDGSIVTWGSESSGGNSRYISGKPGKLKTLANVFTDDFIGRKFRTTPSCPDLTKVVINPAFLIASPKNGKDLIIGTENQDLIGNGPGVDSLKGKGGPDIFYFNAPEGFGRKAADKIKDFDSTNDVLIFGQGRFKSMSAQPSICFATNHKDFKQAVKSDSEFIYNNKNGRLYFNENGDQGGFGKGGLFAILNQKPILNELGIGFSE